jgi:hypothetical protein
LEGCQEASSKPDFTCSLAAALPALQKLAAQAWWTLQLVTQELSMSIKIAIANEAVVP